MSSKAHTVVLTEGQIEEIINGREVRVSIDEDTEVVVRQSLYKEMATPVIRNKYQVMNVDDIDRKVKLARNFRPLV